MAYANFTIDSEDYYIEHVGKIMGILLHVLSA
jgi:hypothetical protein